MSTRYIGEDGRERIKLSDEEALAMYNRGALPLTPEQLNRLKERLNNEHNDRIR